MGDTHVVAAVTGPSPKTESTAGAAGEEVWDEEAAEEAVTGDASATVIEASFLATAAAGGGGGAESRNFRLPEVAAILAADSASDSSRGGATSSVPQVRVHVTSSALAPPRSRTAAAIAALATRVSTALTAALARTLLAGRGVGGGGVIDLHALVLCDGGAVAAACINACALALADAAVPLSDLPIAGFAAAQAEGPSLLDPTLSESRALAPQGSALAVVLPQSSTVVFADFGGGCAPAETCARLVAEAAAAAAAWQRAAATSLADVARTRAAMLAKTQSGADTAVA